jgi:hypothetical protein
VVLGLVLRARGFPVVPMVMQDTLPSLNSNRKSHCILTIPCLQRPSPPLRPMWKWVTSATMGLAWKWRRPRCNQVASDLHGDPFVSHRGGGWFALWYRWDFQSEHLWRPCGKERVCRISQESGLISEVSLSTDVWLHGGEYYYKSLQEGATEPCVTLSLLHIMNRHTGIITGRLRSGFF